MVDFSFILFFFCVDMPINSNPCAANPRNNFLCILYLPVVILNCYFRFLGGTEILFEIDRSMHQHVML